MGCDERRRRRGDRARGRRKKLTAALKWRLQWGEREQWLLDLAAEEGLDPKALQDKPDVPAHLLGVWRAFWDLNHDRSFGFGRGPIPFTAIDRYAVRFGHEGEAFERLFMLIRALDAEFLTLTAPSPAPQG
jgi:hypothetical protein